MSFLSYVVDASVVVKWLNVDREGATREALALLRGAVENQWKLVSSDLLPHEVCNALLRGKGLRGALLEEAVDLFFSLPIVSFRTDLSIVRTAAVIADEYALTFYDAVYVAVASIQAIPLITANVRHQGRVSNVTVLDVAHWNE